MSRSASGLNIGSRLATNQLDPTSKTRSKVTLRLVFYAYNFAISFTLTQYTLIWEILMKQQVFLRKITRYKNIFLSFKEFL